MSFDFNDSPNWVAAVAREREIRESAYLGLPYPIVDGALMLPPLTLRQQMILYAVRSPIVCGGPIHQSDAMAVLWVLQPEYAPANIEGRDAFLTRLEAASLPWPTVVRELLSFIEESMLDAPRPSKFKKSSCGDAPAVCGASIYIEMFASAFGWTRDQILDSPVICLNQERRCLIMKADPKHGLTGGRLSMPEEKKWVLEIRRRAAEEKAALAAAQPISTDSEPDQK